MKELIQQLSDILSERRALLNKASQLEMRSEEILTDILRDLYEQIERLSKPKPVKRDFRTSVIETINEQVKQNPEVEKVLEDLGFKSW